MMIFIVLAAIVATVSAAVAAITECAKGKARSNK